jgi:hypothetical protein
VLINEAFHGVPGTGALKRKVTRQGVPYALGTGIQLFAIGQGLDISLRDRPAFCRRPRTLGYGTTVADQNGRYNHRNSTYKNIHDAPPAFKTQTTPFPKLLILFLKKQIPSLISIGYVHAVAASGSTY